MRLKIVMTVIGESFRGRRKNKRIILVFPIKYGHQGYAKNKVGILLESSCPQYDHRIGSISFCSRSDRPSGHKLRK